MSDNEEKNKERKGNEDAAVKPDAETLNTTDPQDHMEGPVSSLVQKTGEEFEKEDSEEEAKEKKDRK